MARAAVPITANVINQIKKITAWIPINNTSGSGYPNPEVIFYE